MTDIEKEAQEILSKADVKWNCIETEILSKPKLIETNRQCKSLERIPNDIDFEMKDGNTTYEVVSHFNLNGEEYFLNQIIRKLRYKY